MDLPHAGPLSRHGGPVTVVVLVIGQCVLWIFARPGGEPFGSYLGQLFGAESMLLFSIALVLISTLPWVEVWFDGIDRAAIWHRRLAITGLLLLAPHILLSSGRSGALGGPLGVIGAVGMIALALWAILPRWRSITPAPLRKVVAALRALPASERLRDVLGGYERWRSVHRTTGLFVAAGFVHGLLDQTAFAGSPELRWTYVGVGGIGLAFYLYRELLARFFISLHDYQIQSVREVAAGLTEIAFTPLGRPVDFTPGQFAMIYIEAKDGWHRHPFTIASAPHEDVLRVTVKALGDYTSQLPHLLQPGMPAVVGGPHGRFHHRKGTDHQVWIAGGVGVAPFLSWLRALDAHPAPGRVDFFYTTTGADAPFADEIMGIARRHETLHAHIIATDTDGRLTTDRVLALSGGDSGGLSVFMCGPQNMLRAFQRGFRRAGVPARRIHREYFDWR